jgi:O-antigen ligase
MHGWQLNIIPDTEKISFRKRLRDLFIVDKLQNITGIILLLLCAVFVAVVTAYGGLSYGLLLLVLMIAIPVIYAVVVYPLFGIAMLLALAYFLFEIMKYGIPFPMGTLMDGLQVMLIIGFLVQQKYKPNWIIYKNRITTMILIWIIYNIIEVANPNAESRLAWLYTVRSVAFVMLMYFVFMYQIRSVKYIRLLLKMWILFALIGALYGLKQEYIGFSATEEAYLHSDPNIASLLFISGHWRRYSIFSDPVAFSYNMVVAAMLCIALISGTQKFWKRITLGFIASICLFSMLYSGTRGADVLPPIAMVLYAVLKYNKRMLPIAAIIAFCMFVLIFIPTGNPTIVRFQSAFKPSTDESFNVRKANQKRIQPYILSHPLGGGLGATGAWGQRFAPNSYLANFPPDSGYVRVAVELGWIGLFIFCCFMFTALKTGINNYYAIKDKELKTYCFAMTLIVFTYNVGNYPQEAIVQFPSNIYFYLAISLINITMRLDQEKNKSSLANANQ